MSFDGSTALIGLRKIARLLGSLGDKSRYDMRIGHAASIWNRSENFEGSFRCVCYLIPNFCQSADEVLLRTAGVGGAVIAPGQALSARSADRPVSSDSSRRSMPKCSV